MPNDTSTKDLTDSRPMVMARTISAVTVAASVLGYILWKIFVCGCACG
jgi:hypothetical protein